MTYLFSDSIMCHFSILRAFGVFCSLLGYIKQVNIEQSKCTVSRIGPRKEGKSKLL